MKRTSLAILSTLLMMASTTFAATSATGQNNVAPTLQVSANIVSVVQLTLTKGASGTTCNIANPGAPTDYTMDFGTVDALAVTNATCGQKYTPAQTGADAVYYTDYQLNPGYASQPSAANPQITAYVSVPFGSANIKIVRDTANSAAAPAANGFSAMSTNVAAQDAIASAVASGTALTRYIGVDIANTNGAGMTGAKTATVTFTLTVN